VTVRLKRIGLFPALCCLLILGASLDLRGSEELRNVLVDGIVKSTTQGSAVVQCKIHHSDVRLNQIFPGQLAIAKKNGNEYRGRVATMSPMGGEHFYLNVELQDPRNNLKPGVDLPVEIDIIAKKANDMLPGTGVSFAGTLNINEVMLSALKQFNHRFVTWSAQDFTPTIQRDAVNNIRQPYSLSVDFNRDGKGDLILDGHDDTSGLLLCVLSKGQGYDVVVVRRTELFKPGELKNINDGRKEVGLNYYLWPIKDNGGFTVAYPQQSGLDGKLLNDGAVIDFKFKDGKFVENKRTL
jgi:hypothetical protein